MADIHLPPQQLRVLWLYANGNTYAETAEILQIAVPTMKEYMFRAFRTLGARNAAHAIHLAWQHGIFPLTTFEVAS